MAHRVTKRRKAVLSGGLHPHYADVVEDAVRMAERRRGRAARPTSRRPRTCSRRSTTTTPASSCRRPTCSATCATCAPIAEKAHRHGRAARRGVHRGGVARPRDAAGRDGRRHRRRRGPVDRQRAEFRRALCRPVRDASKIRAPDAGPALRRDRGRGRPARLRADALDPRAAYPPRQGDVEHLHQFGAVLPGLHDPHDAARRSGPAAARRASTTPMR